MLRKEISLDFQSLISAVIMSSPYYGQFLTICSRVEDEKIKDIDFSIGVSHIMMRYNPKFCEQIKATHKSLQYKTGVGIVIHNLIHIMLYHPILKSGYTNKDVYDIAADIVANQYVPQSNMIMLPEDSVTHNDFDFEPHLTVKEYYDLLLKYSNQKPENAEKVQSIIDSGVCSHQWIPEEIDGTPSDAYGAGKNTLMQMIDSKIMESADLARMAGNLPGGIETLVNIIIKKRKPVVNWRQIVRRMVGTAYSDNVRSTMMRKSKRFGTFPGVRTERKPKIMVVLDTSGSVSEADFNEFASELNNVYRLTKADIYMLECDTVIEHIYKYKGVMNNKIHGRGGTDFEAPLRESHNIKPNLIIYFTDGFADVPIERPWTSKILWVICSKGITKNPGFPGQVVKMTNEDLME